MKRYSKQITQSSTPNATRSHRTIFLIGILAVAPSALAQFDDFPPPPPPPGMEGEQSDFAQPPPPPPPPAASNLPDSPPPSSAGMRGPIKANSRAGRPAIGKESGKGSSQDDLQKLPKSRQLQFNSAQPEDIADDKFPETIDSFDFPNAEISDVIKFISEITGKNFILDPNVRGKITIIAPSKITVAEAYRAFLSALAMNRLTIVPSGNFLKIKQAKPAQRDSIETYSGTYYPNTDQMITRIVHLKHISAETIQRELGSILRSSEGELNPYIATNSLIISDYGSNIDRIMKILNQLDVPGFEEQLETIQIKHARAKDLADLVDKIVNKGEKKNAGPAGGFSSGINQRFGRSGGAGNQQGNSYFMAFPDERTNSIIAVGNQAGIARIKKLIAQLDFKLRPEESGGVHVYYVKHGVAKNIAQTLSGVTKDSSPKPGAGGNLFNPMGPAGPVPQQEIFGGDVKITADEGTNSLVITASKGDYETVMSILKKIDIARDQVFVEGIIMEMTANDANSWTPGYYQYPSSGYGKAGFNGGLDMPLLLSAAGGAGAILGFAGGKNVQVKDPTANGTTLEIPSLIGFINFLKKVSKANILSTPQIVALDNQEAEIEVGDKVATNTSTTIGPGGTQTSSPTMEEVTIKLTITPFINPSSDSIRMNIRQEIKQASPGTLTAAAFKDTTLPIQKRNIKTNIIVTNGDTAVLGGLMKDEEKETTTKVPLLGDIPILGWLFKSTGKTKEKINMLVFLTPKILRTPQDTKGVVTQKLNERIDFIKANANGLDPYGKKMDDLMKKATAGVPSSTLGAPPETSVKLNLENQEGMEKDKK